MVCKKCGYKNDSDAILCQGCGANLVLEYYDDFEEGKTLEAEDIKEQDQKTSKDNKSEKKVAKNVTKNKTINKTVNKTKNPKEKKNKDKDKNKKSDSKQEVIVIKQGAGIGTRIFIVLLITMILGLSMILSFVGYKYYQKYYNITVPNITGLSYEEAELVLAKKDLNIAKKEEKTTTEDDGKVIYQFPNCGSKRKKGSVITATVAVKDDTYMMPDFIGMKIDNAVELLTKNDINYNIIYEESSELNNVVIKQSIDKNTKIDKDKTITLTVSKNETPIIQEEEKKEE